jgi:hypothetical protein
MQPSQLICNVSIILLLVPKNLNDECETAAKIEECIKKKGQEASHIIFILFIYFFN